MSMCVAQVFLVTGLNREFGISDEWFAIGDSLIITVLGQVVCFSSSVTPLSSILNANIFKDKNTFSLHIAYQHMHSKTEKEGKWNGKTPCSKKARGVCKMPIYRGQL